MKDFITFTSSTLDTTLSLRRARELDTLVTEVSDNSNITEKQLLKRMTTLAKLGFHIFQEKEVRVLWNRWNNFFGPFDIILNSDWKENVKRGRGPVEDSQVIHQIEMTALLLPFQRWNLGKNEQE